MKKSKIFMAVLILLIIAAGSYFGYSKLYVKEGEKDFRVVEVIKDDLEIIISAIGMVKASREINIKSELGGKVVELPFKEGDRVSKGDVIAVIDDKQQEETFIEREANYKNILIQLEKNKKIVDLSKNLTAVKIEERREELFQKETEYEQALERLKEEKSKSKLDIEKGKAALNILEKELEMALAGSREQEINERLEEIDQAEVTAENAKKEMERQKELYEKGYVSERDAEEAEKLYFIAESQYREALEHYDMAEEGTREEQISIIRAQVEEGKKSLEDLINQAELNIKEREREAVNAESYVVQAELMLKEALESAMEIEIKEDEVLSMETELERAEASKNQAQDELSKTKIKSPIDGVIIERNVEPGDVVASQLAGIEGTTLMTLADLETIYAEVNVDEADIGKVRHNLSVDVISAAYEELKIPGIVNFISSRAIQVQQIPAFKVKVKILLDKISSQFIPEDKSPYNLLFPGMSVDTDIYITNKKDVLQIPLEAVWKKDEESYVTIVEGDNVFLEVPVKTGLKNDIMIEILDGIKEGDFVKIPEIDIEETPSQVSQW